jgi:hypothetical protein
LPLQAIPQWPIRYAEIERWVAKTDAIEIISHFTEYHAMMGGIYKSKS